MVSFIPTGPNPGLAKKIYISDPFGHVFAIILRRPSPREERDAFYSLPRPIGAITWICGSDVTPKTKEETTNELQVQKILRRVPQSDKNITIVHNLQRCSLFLVRHLM